MKHLITIALSSMALYSGSAQQTQQQQDQYQQWQNQQIQKLLDQPLLDEQGTQDIDFYLQNDDDPQFEQYMQDKILTHGIKEDDGQNPNLQLEDSFKAWQREYLRDRNRKERDGEFFDFVRAEMERLGISAGMKGGEIPEELYNKLIGSQREYLNRRRNNYYDQFQFQEDGDGEDQFVYDDVDAGSNKN